MNIWWIRRDIRLFDNQALAAAAENGGLVIPVFILDPVFWERPDFPEKRVAFMLSGLRSLDADLRSRGSRLIVRTGSPIEVLTELYEEAGASAIYAEEDYSPYARRRDSVVAERLTLNLMPGLTVFHPRAVLKADGTPYTVFTPFSKVWRALPQPGRSDLIDIPPLKPVPADISSERLPEMPLTANPDLFAASEQEARLRLDQFTEERIFRYQSERNRPDLNSTSGLSPNVRFGMLSARSMVGRAIQKVDEAPNSDAAKGADTWLSELIWREFFQSILYHFPHVRNESFRPAYRRIPWTDDPEDLEAWQTGQTGYPFVDAAMRQLAATGWMHNRPRMVVASFLVKDLAIDWRKGERWFMQHLVDGDVAANNGGWQWSAGTGTDAAPYFRIFNPITQSMKFDPHGEYIRRWVPELQHVPAKYIHQPWKMPLNVQQQVDCKIGFDYPEPIIDHQWARERALSIYKVKEMI